MARREKDAAPLYQDKAGQFYVVSHCPKVPFPESVRRYLAQTGQTQVRFPEAAEEIEKIEQTKVSVRRLTDRAALAWYVAEFTNPGPVQKLLGEAIAAYVPKSERRGKVQISAWVSAALARRLDAQSKAAGVSPQVQLALFAEDGLHRARTARRPRGHAAKKTEVGAVQLQLETSLVEVVGQFAARPTVQTLATAQRAASAVHQSIHAPEIFQKVSAA